MPIFKKTKCRMKWCYSPSRHEDGTCDKFCTYNTTYVQTNADRIRAMTDEELATFLGFTLQDGYCYGAGLRKELKFIPVSELNEMVEWLKKEVDDG